MTSITGNARRDAEQRLDSVDHHLGQLRALITSGALVSEVPRNVVNCGADSTGPAAAREFESVMTETFGRWVLDFLGLGETDPSDAVRVARTRLVGALSKHADHRGTCGGGDVLDTLFIDVFAGEDLTEASDDELGVKPISYEA